jgi:hypothetical protein
MARHCYKLEMQQTGYDHGGLPGIMSTSVACFGHSTRIARDMPDSLLLPHMSY